MRYRYSNVRTKARLQITDIGDGLALLSPATIDADWEDEHDRQMSITIEAANTPNGPEAKSLTITVNNPSDRLLTDDLRIPVDRILQSGMQGGILRIKRTPTGRDYTPLEGLSEQKIPTVRTRRRKTDSVSSSTIAADYRSALAKGINPTAYIMEKYHFSRSKASRLIRQARDDKELGEAIPGRAGEKPLPQSDGQ